MAKSSPIRRQLLGGRGDITDGSAITGPKDYWFPASLDQVPLHGWAAERQPLPELGEGTNPKLAVGGGTQGHGVSHLRALAWGGPGTAAGPAGMTSEAKLQTAHRFFGVDSPQLKLMDEGQGYRNFMK